MQGVVKLLLMAVNTDIKAECHSPSGERNATNGGHKSAWRKERSYGIQI